MAKDSNISLVLPWFCEKKQLSFIRKKEFPNYFDYFIETFRFNKFIDLHVFTNVPYDKYQYTQSASSIVFHKMSLKQCFQLCRERLGITGFNYGDFRAYKLCDFKPMYGTIFSDYIKNAKYWGYCDPDMVIGNLEKNLTEERLAKHELITGTSKLVGYMTLFKNEISINELAKRSPDYQRVINSPQNFRFDECGNNRIIALKQLVQQESIKTDFMSNCVHNDCGKINRDRPWKYLWNQGCLTDLLTGSEIGALHLVKSKRNPEFAIAPLNAGNQIIIDQHGIRNA